MVEMYLHPEIEVMWAQAEQGYSPEQQPLQANLEAVTAAKKLLNDVHVTEESALKHQVLYRPIAISWLSCCMCMPVQLSLAESSPSICWHSSYIAATPRHLLHAGS